MSNISDKTTNFIVKKADIENIPGILSVLENNLIKNKRNIATTTLEEQGFLIHGFNFDDVKSAVHDKNFSVLVALEGDHVIGYTIGCSLDKLKIELKNKICSASSELEKIISSNKIFYHRHIAKEVHKKGIGKQLLQSQMDIIKKLGYQNIICQIAHKPFQNTVSLALHEKFGFTSMGFLVDGDYTLGVYLKNL